MIPQTRILVTCGPAYTPVDAVRRITNHSTGELGVLLARTLAQAGWEVRCFIGEGAQWADRLEPAVQRVPFGTNDDLLQALEAEAPKESVAAVFQAAALCDFQVRGGGTGKLSSRAGTLTLELEPAPKVLARLRALFPAARIIGWKYEVEGTPETVVQKGRAQLQENATDACVLNGPAFGPGFGVLLPQSPILTPLPDKAQLSHWLTTWLGPPAI